MIIDNRKFKVKITASNIFKFKNNYNCKLHDEILVPVDKLSKSSKELIKCRCDICGNILYKKYNDYNRSIKNGGYFSCSRKCSNEKREETNLKKYGVKFLSQSKEIKEKIKNTCLENYGVDNPTKSEEIKEKIKKIKLEKYGNESYNNLKKMEETNLKRYGVKYVLSNQNIRKKIIETNLKKYGCLFIKTNEFKEKSRKTKLEKYGNENYINLEKSKETRLNKYGNYNNFEKIKKTNLKKYKTENVLKNKEIYNKSLKTRKENKLNNLKSFNLLDINEGVYEMKCDNGKNHIFNISYDNFKNRKKYKTILCTICNPIDSCSSGKELQLLKFIKENYNGEIIISSRKIISPYELDIYLPNLNLAFEFNGIYWHSEIFKDENYHKNKSDLCDKKGIQLIHVYENDWDFKKDIIKSIILDKLGKNFKIDINEHKIIKINDEKLIKNFLEENNIDGYIKTNINLGLFLNNELISLISLKNNEIVRFCNKNYISINSFELLYNYIIKFFNLKKLIFNINKSYFTIFINENIIESFEKTKPKFFIINNNKIYNSGNIKIYLKCN